MCRVVHGVSRLRVNLLRRRLNVGQVDCGTRQVNVPDNKHTIVIPFNSFKAFLDTATKYLSDIRGSLRNRSTPQWDGPECLVWVTLR